MLKKEIAELRALDLQSLSLKVTELEKQLFHLKFQQKTMRLNDTSQFKKISHQIAFIKMLETQYAMSQEDDI
jgi:ribosomal protein L29